MLTLHQVDTRSKADVRRFVHLPFKLYRNNPNWVPPILIDAYGQLNRDKHLFYEHSTAGFWIAVQDGEDVGRISALFERAFEWARARKLTEIVGPIGIRTAGRVSTPTRDDATGFVIYCHSRVHSAGSGPSSDCASAKPG